MPATKRKQRGAARLFSSHLPPNLIDRFASRAKAERRAKKVVLEAALELYLATPVDSSPFPSPSVAAS